MDNNFEKKMLENDKKQLTEQNQLLQRKARLLEMEAVDLRRAVVFKKEEIEKLNQRILELESQKESFWNVLNEDRIKKDELKAEIREKDELIEDLRHDLEIARENGKTLYETQCRDNNNLTDKIETLERENREMLQKLKDVEAERNDLEDDNRRWEQVCCDQTDQIEELHDEIEELQKEKEQDEGMDWKTVWKRQSENIGLLLKENRELRTKLKRADFRIDEIEHNTLEVKDRQIDILRTNSECKDQRIVKLLETIKEKERVIKDQNQRIWDLLLRLEKMVEENVHYEQVEHTLKEKDQKIKELQEKLQRFEAANDRMNRLEKEDYLDEIKQEVLEYAKSVEKYPFLFQNYSQADIIEECFDAISRPLRVARYNDDRPCCGRKYRLCCDRYCKPVKRKKRAPENRE